MRIRTVKPEFFDDEKMVGRSSRDARLLFIGLLIHSDDYGVVKGNPKYLNSKIFPYESISDQNFTSWLQQLQKVRAIIPFKHKDESYYFIRTFSEHQIINKPSKFRNPTPPQDILIEDYGSATVVLPVGKELEGKGRERKGEEGKGDLTSSNLSASGEAVEFYRTKKGRKLKGEKLEWFTLFWDAFDHKKDQRNAADAWLDINDLTAELAEKIIAGAKREGEVERRPNEARKMAQGWLNDGRWEDETRPQQPKKTRAEENKEENRKWVIDGDREDRERAAKANAIVIEGEVLDD